MSFAELACAPQTDPRRAALLLHAMAPQFAGFRVDILATDLSSEVIERAKAGLYSQFEVPDARRVYTTFEQPDLKAPFTFTVTAPAHWKVVSNAATPQPVRWRRSIAW